MRLTQVDNQDHCLSGRLPAKSPATRRQAQLPKASLFVCVEPCLYTTRMNVFDRQSMGTLRRAWPNRRGHSLVVSLAIVILLSSSSCSLHVSSGRNPVATLATGTQISGVATSTSTGTAGTDTPTANATSTAAGRTPAPSGQQTLTLAAGGEDPATLDPALVQTQEMTEVARQLFRGLVKLSPDMTAVPDLAEKVDVSSDETTYTFHLRKGIEFASGQPIRAGDVQFSLDRALDPALANKTGGVLPALIFLSDIRGAIDRASGKADHISGVQVVDDLTLRITLQHPVVDFLVKFAGTPASVVNRSDPQKGSDWWKSPDSSGPFVIGSWTPGQKLVLKPNKHYLPEPPTLQTVTLLYGAGASDPFTLYERHQVDLAGVPYDVIDRVQAPNSGFQNQLVVQPLLSIDYIFLNPNVAPFNDERIRKAVIGAFDRSRIATVTFNGHAEVANSIVPQGLDNVDWTAQIPPYDPAGAKELLSRTSLDPNNSGIAIYAVGDYASVALKLQLEQNLGVKADVIQEEGSDYLIDIASQKLTAVTLGWIADYPGPEDFLRELFYSTSDENPIGYHNADVDKLLDEALAEPDPARRADLYKQAQQKIIDDAVVIPIYSDKDYELVRPYVHGLQVTSVGLLDLESVWITK